MVAVTKSDFVRVITKFMASTSWKTNPKKAAYNRVYNRTTRGCLVLVLTLVLVLGIGSLGLLLAKNL